MLEDRWLLRPVVKLLPQFANLSSTVTDKISRICEWQVVEGGKSRWLDEMNFYIFVEGFGAIKASDGSEEKVVQILDQLQSASRKIESVIRRVMDFTKSSEPQLSLIDINVPIEEAINLSAVSLRKRRIKIEKYLAENLPFCYLDAQLIEQVMLNLITNAAEAMMDMQETKTIAVTSTVVKDQIRVSVSDSGPGVPPESREIIFDPFYTTKNGSSGIGLSLSHRIITDHGGSLTALAGELGGAEVRIEIPIHNKKSIEDPISGNRELL